MTELCSSIQIEIDDAGRASVRLPDTLPIKALPQLAHIIEDATEFDAVTRGTVTMGVQQMVATGALYRRDGKWFFRDSVKESDDA